MKTGLCKVSCVLVGGFVILCGNNLNAQSKPWRLGAQVSVNVPVADMADDYETGFGAAFFTEKAWNTFGLRAKLEYSRFNLKDIDTYYVSMSGNTSLVSLTGDWIWYFSQSSDKGMFGFWGAGIFNIKTDVNTYGSVNISGSGDATRAGLNLGFGYNFNRNLGAEVKIVGVLAGSDNESATIYTQASFSYRF